MNKNFALFAVVFSVLSLADTRPARAGVTAETTFMIRSELGTKKTYRLAIKDGSATLNGIRLPDSALITEQPALALAFSTKTSPEPRTCAGGLFEHDVTREGKTTRERGCTGEPRYRALYTAFEALLNRA